MDLMENTNSLDDVVVDSEIVDEDLLLEEPSSSGMDEASAEQEAELKAIKERMKEMDDEVKKLNEMQNEAEKQFNTSATESTGSTSPPSVSLEDKIKADNNSVYVGNVDYGTTQEALEAHFNGCGVVNRITIPLNKFNGNPKGFAYIEFCEPSSVELAMKMDESLLRGRQIKVMPKRTNRPGFSTTNRLPRRGGAGYRGRGSHRPSRGFSGRFTHPRGYSGHRGNNHFTPY
ncbi:PREDICTED: polyadenylate-binding protein 2-A-like [Nicrophorus vespilloides]|uniref:Polyadenylate-binding protein 2-A-like n=1 Tax=Nicrophorus vespilloides TaxID=110193 RepID=A0ABM1N6M3_NICVS|nr:PREDICTED: polyadenylate-binding protein 2-A-like [Nicrophorus vespilloides]